MSSMIHVMEKNIAYSSDSIKMWRLIMQHNPSTLVPLHSKHKLYNDLTIWFISYIMQTTMDQVSSDALLLKENFDFTVIYLMNEKIPLGFHWQPLVSTGTFSYIVILQVQDFNFQ